MKKILKLFFAIFCCFLIILIGSIIYFAILTSNVKLQENKLIDLQRSITYYDCNGQIIAEQVNGKTICEIEKIPEHTLNAFISIEDKRFYSHNGVDVKGLIRSSINNVKSMSFKEGASTITQQLIKNTHLTSEKTIARKASEIKLALLLERKYTKRQILEKYLNTIYFGDNCYGISSAVHHYFDKDVSMLSLNESAFLAGMIKAPSSYSPSVNYDKCVKRKNIVLKKMYEQGYISIDEYYNNINKSLEFSSQNNNSEYDYLYMATKELNSILNRAFYGINNLKIYTNFDKTKQADLTKNLLDNKIQNVNKSGVLIENDGKVCAYYSTCGNAYRQVGSTLKPFLVYAPAIENNIVYSASKILDEKTDFNGYSPKNYNDKYLGYVSIKESLAKSLNVCAVKLLNYTGVEKALDYLNKTDITTTKNDNSLCLALGATEKGATLTQLSSIYSVFNQDGYYSKPYFIEKIADDTGNIIYQHIQKNNKIFSSDTISIMNDMLSYTVHEGTAKKLSYCNFPLYAKTGTVGNENGNSDAYTISYNSEYILGVWYGAKDNLMDNKITGGNIPALCSKNIWQDIYNSRQAPPKIFSKGIIEKDIDKISYDQDNEIVLSDPNSPKRYTIKAIFKENHIPLNHSSRFSNPKIDNVEILVNNNKIQLRLCVAEYVNFLVYRENCDKKELVYDSLNNKRAEFCDNSALPGKTYCYSIVPYFIVENKKIYGKEVKLKEIKLDYIGNDNWWIEN